VLVYLRSIAREKRQTAAGGGAKMVSLDDVSIFITVVERQNFSAAALELKISPSAVSKRISRLEHDLRAKLINRSSRRISLTAAGSAFFEACSGIRPIVDEATRAVQGLHNVPGGKLRVHSSTGVGIKLIAPLIPAFLRQFPELELDLVTRVQGPRVVTQGVDVFLRTVDIHDKMLDSRDLGVCRYVICATSEYLKTASPLRTPDDLKQHSCLLYLSDKGPIDKWPFAGADGDYAVNVKGSFASNSSSALYEALMRGYGIALLPMFSVVDDIKAKRVVTVFDGQVTYHSRLRAYYPRSPHIPINVRLFLDFVETQLQTVPKRVLPERSRPAK
jgi:DNA-binding transcriptional LysR family regulator